MYGTMGASGRVCTNGRKPEEAALRELKEETNIDNIYMEQLYTWGMWTETRVQE